MRLRVLVLRQNVLFAAAVGGDACERAAGCE